MPVQLFGCSVDRSPGHHKLPQTCILGVRPASADRSTWRLRGLWGAWRSAPNPGPFSLTRRTTVEGLRRSRRAASTIEMPAVASSRSFCTSAAVKLTVPNGLAIGGVNSAQPCGARPRTAWRRFSAADLSPVAAALLPSRAAVSPKADSHGGGFVFGLWSRRSESNRRPAVYKTAALPLSYAGRHVILNTN